MQRLEKRAVNTPGGTLVIIIIIITSQRPEKVREMNIKT
jgi:hypothetical protein